MDLKYIKKKNKFALLNLIDREPEELWTETRNIREKWEKTMDDKRNTKNY